MEVTKKTPQNKLDAMRRYREKKSQDPAWVEAQAAYSRQYRQDHAKEIKRQQQERYKKNARKFVLDRYGITEAVYNKLLLDQAGQCAICRGAPTGRWGTFCVDHDHITGAIRGLLCDSCNRGLGYFKEKSEVVEMAAQYLRNPPAQSS